MHKPEPTVAPEFYVEAAERGLITAMRLNPRSIPRVCQIVSRADLGNDAHRDFFSLLVNMDEAGQSVLDEQAVAIEVAKSGLIPRLGGMGQFRANFIDGLAGIPENVLNYANEVRAASIRRRLVALSEGLVSRAKSGDPGETIGWAESELSALQSMASPTDRGVRLKAASQKVARDIRATIEQGTSRGVLTGFGPFDDNYGGLQPGSLSIVAARPSLGKSAWSWNVAENMSSAGRPVLFVSLEMSEDELAARSLASRTRINGKRIATHNVTDSDLARIEEEANEMPDIPLTAIAPTGRAATLDAIRAAARVHKATEGLDALFIDYCQIVEKSHSKETDYELATKCGRAFKGLARELKIPVVLLAQLNRQSEIGNRAPRKSDLRDSGALEQDADNLAFLHRPSDDPMNTDTQLLVRKWRGAGLKDFDMRFDGRYTRFEMLDPNDQGREWSPVATEFE